MERVYELDVYKLAEALSDMIWHDTVQKHEGQISNFQFLISTFRERLLFMFMRINRYTTQKNRKRKAFCVNPTTRLVISTEAPPRGNYMFLY